MTGPVRILVVEDHYSIATELGAMLRSHGYGVIGPVGTVAAAMAALGEQPDLALLDVNLHGLPVFPVADRLRTLGIAFAFTSGYDVQALPVPYRMVPRLGKPVDQTALSDMLHSLLRPGRAA